jgi:hypothetical protein
MNEIKKIRLRSRLCWAGVLLLGILSISAGTLHFVSPGFYIGAMPPYIPWPLGMIYFTGVGEILGGIGVLVPDDFVFRSTRTGRVGPSTRIVVPVTKSEARGDRYTAVPAMRTGAVRFAGTPSLLDCMDSFGKKVRQSASFSPNFPGLVEWDLSCQQFTG